MRIKVATWNLDQLHFIGARALRQLEHIRAISADVWVLTETHDNFAPGPDYHCIARSNAAPDLPNGGARWVAIWSRLPATVEHLTADLERTAAIRLTVGSAVFVGTVLPWLRDTRQHPLNGSAAFRERLTEQTADWARLREEHDGRVCVAGDFNQDLIPTGHYYHSAISRQALRTALGTCGLDCLTGEANDPLAVVPNLASIDHICVGKRLIPNPIDP
jgi:hypothetical protein